MTDIDGDLSHGDDIDIDRAIIDPDYRRVVIALLRQKRSPAEQGPPLMLRSAQAGERED